MRYAGGREEFITQTQQYFVFIQDEVDAPGIPATVRKVFVTGPDLKVKLQVITLLLLLLHYFLSSHELNRCFLSVNLPHFRWAKL
jgi:hypothetical protein